MEHFYQAEQAEQAEQPGQTGQTEQASREAGYPMRSTKP
jgi:hypothetical protein